MEYFAQVLEEEEQIDNEFLNYLAQAQFEVLKDRENKIFELRYGMTGEKPYTLEAIGNKFNLSRERIRQLLNKSTRKIVSKGTSKIKAGIIDSPCAVLILYIRSIIRPAEENSAERLVEFLKTHLSDFPIEQVALPLLASLTYSNKKNKEENLEKARLITKKIEHDKNSYCKIQKLLTDVIYPKQKINCSDFSIFHSKRKVAMNNTYSYSGEFYSQKLSRFIQYESFLEKSFLLNLERHNEVIFYQEQPLKIDYKNIYGNNSSYYPDILFILNDGTGVITEIKPIWQMALQNNLLKWSALREYSRNEGLGILITDGRSTIQQIQKHEVNPDFADFVLKELQKGSICWNEYKNIKDKFQLKTKDFVALVLNNRLIWHLSPFYLAMKDIPNS